MILRTVEQAELDVRTLSDEATGTVNVGLAHSVMQAMALPLMQSARRDCPGVTLHLVEGLSGVLFDSLVAGRLDLALVYNPPSDSRIESRPVVEEDLICVGTEEIVGPPGRPISFAEVTELPLLLPSQGYATRALIENHALRSKLQFRAPLQIDSLTAMDQALPAGMGCSVLAHVTVRRLLAEGLVCSRPIVDPPISRSLHFVMPRNKPQTRSITVMRQLMLAAAAGEIAAGRWQARFIDDTDL